MTGVQTCALPICVEIVVDAGRVLGGSAEPGSGVLGGEAGEQPLGGGRPPLGIGPRGLGRAAEYAARVDDDFYARLLALAAEAVEAL